MNTEELKVYTEQVKELETRLYTNKKMHKEHMKILDDSLISAPQKGYLVAPEAPNPEDYIPDFPAHSTFGFLLACFAATTPIMTICMFFSKLFHEGFIKALTILPFSYWIVIIIESFIVIFYFYCRITDNKEHAIKIQEGQKKLTEAQDAYLKDLEHYADQCEQYEQNFEEECRIYNEDYLPKHQNVIDRVNDLYEDLDEKITTSLEELYDMNVIFPKYRNLVAITSINEYLMSGRCYELEGPDGAYNLYETELRQNLIINKLSDIVDNLEKIRDNQYSLYEVLKNSNRTIKALSEEARKLNETSKLTQYYTETVAKAAEAPKIVYAYTREIG